MTDLGQPDIAANNAGSASHQRIAARVENPSPAASKPASLRTIAMVFVLAVTGCSGDHPPIVVDGPSDAPETLLKCTPSAALRCPGGAPWEAHHGLTPMAYQQMFDMLAGQGYRLSHVTGYSVGGQETYAGIWEKCTAPPWEARNGLTSAAFQQVFDALVAQGYRLVEVSSYGVGSTELHAGIWEQRSGPDWKANHGLTATEYQQTFDTLVAQGYRPIHVSGYSTSGEERYSAIWEMCEGGAWEARHGLTSTEYQQSFDALVGAGYRPLQVSGDNVGGQDVYAAIFDKSPSAGWQALHGLASSAAYQQEFDTLVNQGYRLSDISGYEGKYAGIWTK
jgi:hypothetical protein